MKLRETFIADQWSDSKNVGICRIEMAVGFVYSKAPSVTE